MWVSLERVRPASGLAMFLALEAYLAVLLWSNREPTDAVGRFIARVDVATSGSTTGWFLPLVFPLVALGLVAYACLHLGGIRAVDFGWRRSAVVPALALTFLFWACGQALLRYLEARADREPTPDVFWQEARTSVLVGLLVQLLGNALVEETFFRGLLLPQVFLRSARRMPRSVALAVATSTSVALFTISHVPRLVNERAFTELAEPLAVIALFGLLLSVVYLVTRNLFLCVGLHSLWNARPSLLEVPWERYEQIWYWLTAALVVVWWLGQRARSRSPKRPLESPTVPSAP
jgi:CAAX protease family protein